MKNITETVHRYVSAWNEKTPEVIKAALQQCCAVEITYTDKQTQLIAGIEAFVKLIMASYEMIPGRSFTVLTQPEYFDHNCTYSWGINIPGKGDLAGRDYLKYNDENLITKIIGFVPG